MKSAIKASPNLPNMPFTVFPTSTGLSKLLPTDLPTRSKSPSFFFFLSESSSIFFVVLDPLFDVFSLVQHSYSILLLLSQYLI